MKGIRILILIGVLLHGISESYAQEEENYANTEKLYVHPYASGGLFRLQGRESISSFGGGLKLGYGFSKLFTLYVGSNVSIMGTIDYSDDYPANNFQIGLAQLGGQFNFHYGPKVVSYLDIALVGAGASFIIPEGDRQFSGGGVTASGGVRYFTRPAFALDLNLAFSYIHFSRFIEPDRSEEIRQLAYVAKINFGISWFPFISRSN